MDGKELFSYLDDYLNIAGIPDYGEAYNGLQVEGARAICRVAVTVDACIGTIEQAIRANADLLIVHHGLFWGAKAPIIGRHYRRLSLLMKNDIALYSCHLPLDVHLEVGNNQVLARLLGLTPSGDFAEYKGTPVGIYAETNQSLPEFIEKVNKTLGVESRVLAVGSPEIKRVGILTGGGGSSITAAARAGIDILLTGEGNHHSYFDAEELGINVIYAGHYATETLGVCALAKHLEERFGLETLFVDHPTNL